MSLKEATQVVNTAAPGAISAVPPNISDITAILDQQKRSDPALAEQQRAAAQQKPPAGVSRSKLIEFYRKRAAAAGSIGDTEQELNDLNEALKLAKRTSYDLVRQVLWDLSISEGAVGQVKAAVRHKEEALKLVRKRGRKMVYSTVLSNAYVRLGDLGSAQQKLAVAKTLLKQAQSWRSWRKWKNHWLRLVAHANATFLEAKGNLPEAEHLFRESIKLSEADIASGKAPLPIVYVQYLVTATRLELSRNLQKQGRIVEAEVVVRKALVEQLKVAGRYTTWIPRIMLRFAEVLTAQGRYAEALKMTDAAITTMTKIGFGANTGRMISARQSLARLALLSGDVANAIEIYDQIVQDLKDDPSQLQRIQSSDVDLWLAYALGGRHQDVVAAATRQKTDKRRKRPFADAIRNGAYAISLAALNQPEQAFKTFNAVVPFLTTGAKDSVDEEYTISTARSARSTVILEGYIGFLADIAGTATEAKFGIDATAEAFRIADAARGQSVQRAVAAASARVTARDEKLAALVRSEQDTRKRVSAQSGLLATILASPSDQQDAKAIKALRGEIAKLKAALKTLTSEINSKYPEYAALLNPKPPTVETVRAALQAMEAFISIYVGRESTYVWALPKAGEMAFAKADINADRLTKVVAALRDALNPTAETLGDIPDFDVRLAHKLYRQLLEPVAGGWQAAKSLLVTSNGALGQLPLAVLPTKRGRIEDGDGTLFAGYRRIAWLTRTHAVTTVPSAATLVTLRALPEGDANREPFLGFGNPVFDQAALKKRTAEVATAGKKNVAMRGVALKTRGLKIRLRAAPKVQSLETRGLSSLPLLPDTETEVLSLAKAMRADPEKSVRLKNNASEKEVRSLDLRQYKVIAFATHGLIPGDLTGLREPALALAAPANAVTDGDGILTMSEIMSLRLDADWVVLSACNTGTARGDGAEAVSGLGRAFFYAGTRSLLVSSWPVETTSARLLTTDLFERQTNDAKVSRAEALRQAMSALIDKPGVIDQESGEPLFYYAHPIFWAPFILVGDGGS